MTISNIKETINSDIYNVWETVLAVDKYGLWRSDLRKAETVNQN